MAESKGRFVRQFGPQVQYDDEEPKKAFGLRVIGGGYAMIRFDEISAITSDVLGKFESTIHLPGGALKVQARFDDLCSYALGIGSVQLRGCYSNHPPEENTSSKESPDLAAPSIV